MAMKLEVDGAGRLVDELSRFEKEIYKILQKEVRQAAGLVAEDAKRRTPAKVLFGTRPFGGQSAGWGKWSETRGRTGGFGAVTFETSTRSLDWDETRVDRSIKAGARKRRVRGAGTVGIAGIVTINDPAGAIWSTAGGANPGGVNNRYFNPAIRARYGEDYPRALKPALFDKGPQAREEIDHALERAQARYGLT